MITWWRSHNVRLTLWYVTAMWWCSPYYAGVVFTFVSRNVSEALDLRIRSDFQWATAMVGRDARRARPRRVPTDYCRPIMTLPSRCAAAIRAGIGRTSPHPERQRAGPPGGCRQAGPRSGCRTPGLARALFREDARPSGVGLRAGERRVGDRLEGRHRARPHRGERRGGAGRSGSRPWRISLTGSSGIRSRRACSTR